MPDLPYRVKEKRASPELAEDVVQTSPVPQPSIQEHVKHAKGAPYENVVWVLYFSLQLLWILDRFFTNLWPRQNFDKTLSGSSDFGSTDGFELKPGPWSVKFYDVCARISGRYSILALNMLFLTQMHSMFFWLQERPTLNRIVDFSRSMAANDRMHRINGWLMMVLILVHVWSILLPCIFDGYTSEVISGFFKYPLSEQKPKGFKDVNAMTQQVMLQVDDVYRLILMTLMLGLLLPLSVRLMRNAYHVGILLHGFIAVMFFIDIVRRHTHPHSWVLNTPFFAFWIINKLVSRFWRRHPTSRIHMINISEDYACVYWTDEDSVHWARKDRVLAFECYMKVEDSGFLEPTHPFTGFTNRCDIALPGATNDPDHNPCAVTSCFVIRRYHTERACPLSDKDRVPQTARLCVLGEDAADTVHGLTDQRICRWGPFVSAYSNELSQDLIHGLPGRRALVCVCGGSGIAIVLDVLQVALFPQSGHKTAENSDTPTQFFCIFSTNDSKLHDWVLEYGNKLFEKAHPSMRRLVSFSSASLDGTGVNTKMMIRNHSSAFDDCTIEDLDAFAFDDVKGPRTPSDLDLSDTRDIVDTRHESAERVPSKDGNPLQKAWFTPVFTGSSSLKVHPQREEIEAHDGRQNMDDLIPCGSKVYVVGGAGLMAATQQSTLRNNCDFVAGPQYV